MFDFERVCCAIGITRNASDSAKSFPAMCWEKKEEFLKPYCNISVWECKIRVLRRSISLYLICRVQRIFIASKVKSEGRDKSRRDLLEHNEWKKSNNLEEQGRNKKQSEKSENIVCLSTHSGRCSMVRSNAVDNGRGRGSGWSFWRVACCSGSLKVVNARFVHLLNVLHSDSLAEKFVWFFILKALCCRHETVALLLQVLDNVRNLCNWLFVQIYTKR